MSSGTGNVTARPRGAQSFHPDVAVSAVRGRCFPMQFTFFCMVCHAFLPSLKCIAEYFPLQGTNGSLFAVTFFFPAVIPTSGGLGSRAGHYWSHSLDYSIPGVLRSITDWRLDRSRIPWGCNIVSRRELKNIPLSRKGEVLFECQAEASEGICMFLFKLVPFLLHFATLFSKLNFPWRGEATLVLKRAPLQYNRTFSSLAGETKN